VLIASLLLPARPASAATYCTVTINSPQERDALQAAFPAAQFVELTDFASPQSADRSDWLPRACRAGVRCDVLLISGHFANGFFGDGAFDLPLQTLEQRSCESRCAELLGQARLVFLFGCNTLAGKQADRRGPQDYRDILVADGVATDRADRIVAARYGPLGRATRARIRKVFAPGSLILGFSSVGPTGEVAGPRFSRFLTASRSLVARWVEDGWRDPRLRARLARRWLAGFDGLNPAWVAGGPPLSPNECRFRDPGTSRLDKLLSAEQLLAAGPVQNALLVEAFLDEHDDWTDAEVAVLARIRDNEAARQAVLAVLPRLATTPHSDFAMLRLARRLDWIDEPGFEARRDRRLRAILADGVTSAELDLVCGETLTYRPPDDVLARNRGSVRFVRALPCLAARGPAVRRFLLDRLTAASPGMRVAAADALVALELLEPGDAEWLQPMYPDATVELKQSLLWALAAAAPADADVQRFIAAASADPDEGVAWTSAHALKQIGCSEVEALLTLTLALDRPEGFVRRSVAIVLEALRPESAAVHEALRPFRNDPDPVVRAAVAKLLAP
jgi:hypothetical protein